MGNGEPVKKQFGYITRDQVKDEEIISVLNKKNKDTILHNLRNAIDDINKLDILIADLTTTPPQTHLLKQAIANNKLRLRRILWELTGYRGEDKEIIGGKKNE